MKRAAALLAALLLSSSLAAGQSLPDLFQEAKAQVKGGSWAEALGTLDALEAESVKPGNEAAHQQLAAPTAFYRAVCEANLGRSEKAVLDFGTFLQLQPRATMDPSMYSKKAITAFETAKKNAASPDASAGADPGSMFAKFQEFRAPANSSEPVNDAWADGPIQWIITPEEKRTWSELLGGAERQEFVDRFWEARNPRPGNPDNPYKTSFERRVAFADASFVQVEGTRGSLTDRGMVFVLLGPPSFIGRKPIRSGDDPTDSGLSLVGSRPTAFVQRLMANAGEPAGESGSDSVDAVFGPGTKAAESNSSWREIWHYRKELLPKSVRYQQVEVEFVTKSGYGVNVLQRTTQTNATLDAAHARPVKD